MASSMTSKSRRPTFSMTAAAEQGHPVLGDLVLDDDVEVGAPEVFGGGQAPATVDHHPPGEPDLGFILRIQSQVGVAGDYQGGLELGAGDRHQVAEIAEVITRVARIRRPAR